MVLGAQARSGGRPRATSAPGGDVPATTLWRVSQPLPDHIGVCPVRVLRVIARMNLGGPAYHVSLLSGRMDARRFSTVLVSGRVPPGEGSSDHLAARYGARHVVVPSLGPELRPGDDLRALREVTRIARAFRPDIVHTHTAKAGMIGRLAAELTGRRPRPIVIHTYHGHVLEGYFSRPVAGFYRALEHAMARRSNRLIGVSTATVDDLVRLGVAPREKFEVIPLGLELDEFLTIGPEPSGSFRAELDVRPGEVLATWVGRLVPIKRVDVLLRAVARARDLGAPLRLALVGDGELRTDLEAQAAALGIAEHVSFVGYRRDLTAIVAATDIAVLTSDNEGTPVALIEAGAGARPLVATRAGGVPDVVVPDAGLLAERGDHEGVAEALARLAGDGELRRQMGAAARAHVASRYRYEALLERMTDLYERLLSEARRSA
jgi:glycosyltransferase involved in cell wall biosynthesis